MADGALLQARKAMKKVLIIAYNFPPSGGSGVQRVAKFTKYLPDFGWTPIILTADYRFQKQARDFSLAGELSSSLTIYRSFTLDARWLFKLLWGLKLHKVVTWISFHWFIPDPEILWLPFAKAKLPGIIKRHQPQLVFISGPPFSPMLLGKWIKERYHIPYIVSFRDDWSLGQSRLDNHPSPRFLAKDRYLEQLVLSHASHVIATNRAYRDDFLALYPQLSQEHYSVITNGYDEADFSTEPKPAQSQRAYLQIVYPGSLYGRRNPAVIWQALHELIVSGEIDPAKLRIEIYGQNYPGFVFGSLAEDSTVRRSVRLNPYLPHPQAVNALQQADVLLLFSGPGPKSDVVIPGKLFEYLRSGKPVLAIINPQGICADILNTAGSGFIADSSSKIAIKEKLLLVYRLWHDKKLRIDPDWDYIRGFERYQLTSQLAKCFDRVTRC